MPLQRPDLLPLLALGTTGGEPLADGTGMAPGVHLQWQPKGGLGFPTGGFDVYRRPHLEGNAVCVTFGRLFAPSGTTFSWMGFDFVASAGPVSRFLGGCGGGGALQLPGVRTLDVTPPAPTQTIQITVDGIGPSIAATAYWETDDGPIAVAHAVSTSGRGERVVTLHADRIDRVRIFGTTLRVCRVCATLVADGIALGWGAPLNPSPLVLPVTDAGWPTTHPNSPDDQAEAEARLPAALAPDQQARYASAFADALRPMLVDLVRSTPQSSWAIHDEGSSVVPDRRLGPLLRVPGLHLLALQSLDPNVARMLGTTFVDTTASAGTLYDYKVVGHYGAERWPGRSVTFTDLEFDRVYVRPLARAGLTLHAARPKVVAPRAWGGLKDTAIGLDPHPTLRSPLWALFEEPTRSASVRVGSGAGVIVAAFDGALPVGSVSVPAGDQIAHVGPGVPFDRIAIDSADAFWTFEIVLREAPGPLGDIEIVTFRHEVAPPAPVRSLDLEAHALPLDTGIRPDGTLTTAPNAAGLAWREAPSTVVVQDASMPALVRVERDGAVVNADSPALIARGDALGLQPDGWPAARLHFVDRDLPDGTYTYAVQGIGLFGRLGPLSAPVAVELLDTVAPPTPAATRASYVDDDHPALVTGELPTRAAGSTLLDVAWVWTGRARLQAPDVEDGGEIRVYRQDGERDRLTGTVTAASVSSKLSVLTTDQSWVGDADALIGESIRLGRVWFTIVGNGTGPDFTITVENLAAPDEAPTRGPFLLTFRAAGPNATDWRRPTSWTQRIHAEPARADGRVAGTITARSGTGATRVLTTDISLADPDGVLVPGALVAEGQVWDVVSHELGAPLKLTIATRTAPDGSTLAPAVGSPFAYVAGVRYHAQIPTTLPLADGEAVAVAWIGVSASDGKTHVADDPAWSAPGRGGLGARPGNEGPVGAAARVFATRHEALPPPAPPAAGDPIYAEPADYHGIARYTLAWDAVAGAAGYLVHRATGAGLARRDVEQRRLALGHYASLGPLDDDFGLGASAWFAAEFPELTEADLRASESDEVAEAWRAFEGWFYRQLTDVELQSLADRAGNEAAFALARPDAVPTESLLDELDGRGNGVVLYRVQAVGASGNGDRISATYPPVHLRDVTGPAPPVILDVLSDENRVIVRWRKGSETDLVGYRVYRSADPDGVSDVRRAEPHASVPTTADDEIRWTDEGLALGEVRYYRVVAHDTVGNVSSPSPVVSGRAIDSRPPNPPQWERAEWVRMNGAGDVPYDEPGAETLAPAIALGWLAHEAGTTCTLQRRADGERLWIDVASGLAPLEPSDPSVEDARRFRTYDSSADPRRGYAYRVRISDVSGNFNTFFFATRHVAAVE